MPKFRPYEFKPDDAYDFARFIGVQYYQSGDEIALKRCPYCNGTGKGNERKFSINLKTGQFKCLRSSCGVSGNMITLSKDFDFSLGTEIDEYYKPKKTFRKLATPKEPIKPKSAAITYLESRGISEKIANEYQITTQNDHDNILVFPFFDENNRMQFVKYRKTDFDKEKDNAKEWCEKNCKPILFGMNRCNRDNKTLIVTEGQMDSLSVAECGIENAVSVPTGSRGMTWVSYCWNWVNTFDEIIIFGDCEKGHITLLDDFKSRFKLKIRCVKEEDYLDCKDANDILRKYGKEQIKKCIENAELIPLHQVIELADVESINIFDIEKMATGVSEMDRLLYGGLPFGGLTLLSGKAGEGKSTLASQMMANAIRQGYKVFAYSGELNNNVFRNWFDLQVAGSNHIAEEKDKWGLPAYRISKTNRQLIENWYRGKFFMYNNNDVDGNELVGLVELIENVVMQYGVRVIFLDNLMTALDLENTGNSDKYERQSLFVKKLARLCLKYNILIVLIAHKRKNNFSTNENDEVMGSSDITNLATVTIAYEKNGDIDETQRLLKVSKNRLFGRTNTSGWVMKFDEKSKRIYCSQADLEESYGWNPDDNGFI